MRLHDSFEWDEDKAAKNLKKHGSTIWVRNEIEGS